MKQTKSITLSTIVTAFAFTIVLYTACKKDGDGNTVLPTDACFNVKCQNDGKCTDGKCSCPLEYEGDKCEKKVLDRYMGSWKGDVSCIPQQMGSGARTLEIKAASVAGIRTVWIFDSIEAVLITPDSLNIPTQQFGYYPGDSLKGYIKYEQGKIIYNRQDIRWSNAVGNKPDIVSCTGYLTRQ